MSHVLDMNGYGWYVWSSYVITLSVFSFNLISALYQKKQIKKYVRHFLTNPTHPS